MPIQGIRAATYAAATALMLVACGGGGGGGSGTNTGGSGGASTSLVPTPGPAGSVLYANASDLRPLRAKAQWQYHGRVTPNGGAVSTYYTASAQQTAAAGVALLESTSDVLLSGSASSTVALVNGAVSVQVTDPLGTGGNEVATYNELRSPVRANDQYTLLERTDVPLSGDVDGDGRPDVADVAIYSTVVGTESVTLRELSRTISAVRVDTTLLLRAKKSSDGTPLPVSNVVQTSWYAAGVGVVRRTQTAATTIGVGPVEYDETLFSWDGVVEGLGSIGPTPALVPAGVSPISGLLLPHVFTATVVGDHALAAADTLRVADPTSLTLAVFDNRGALQSVREYPGLLVNPSNTVPRLHSLDSTTALLAMPVSSFGMNDLRLQRVDATAGLVGNSVTVSVGASSDIVSAWDGQALWLAWRIPGTLVAANVMLQPFSADGQPLANAQLLDTESSSQIGSIRIAAAPGKALVTWVRNDLGTASYRYAIVQGANATADVRTLGTGTMPYFTEGGRVLVPVLGSGVAALQWSGPFFSFSGGGPLPETQPRGVTLDANWSPQRSTSGNLDSELLPASWAGAFRPPVVGAKGDRIVACAFASQQQIPELVTPSDFVVASFVQPGAIALASAATSETTLQNISGTALNFNQFGAPIQLLIWDDRALVFGDNSNRTMASLFWLR